MSSYIPTREADLKTFALNFSSLITANPAKYGLVAGDATEIDAAVEDFATKWDLAKAPPTRTAASIVAKNDAKAMLIPILRGYAMLIKANRAVNNEDKSNLHLHLNDSSNTPQGEPQSQPIVNLVGMTSRRHVLRFADMLTPESRARPAGVSGLQLFCHLGETPPANPLVGAFKGIITQAGTSVDFDLADAGKTAWYFARWQTARGLVGPWSEMVRAGIAA